MKIHLPRNTAGPDDDVDEEWWWQWDWWLIAGGKVYMACRSLERASAAADEIKQKAGVDDSQLIVMQLDLSSLSSVRSFANSFKTST